MATRVIRHINNFVNKEIPNAGFRIPCVYSAQELMQEFDFNKEYDRQKMLAVMQSLNEIYIWDNLTWEQRSILAPIVDVKYDIFNIPSITFPYFQPLLSENEAANLHEDEVLNVLQQKMESFGYSDERIGWFLETLTDFCESFDMNEDEILQNLNNIGYNPAFGVRIIDYGLSNEILRWYTNKRGK